MTTFYKILSIRNPQSSRTQAWLSFQLLTIRWKHVRSMLPTTPYLPHKPQPRSLQLQLKLSRSEPAIIARQIAEPWTHGAVDPGLTDGVHIVGNISRCVGVWRASWCAQCSQVNQLNCGPIRVALTRAYPKPLARCVTSPHCRAVLEPTTTSGDQLNQSITNSSMSSLID